MLLEAGGRVLEVVGLLAAPEPLRNRATSRPCPGDEVDGVNKLSPDAGLWKKSAVSKRKVKILKIVLTSPPRTSCLAATEP